MKEIDRITMLLKEVFDDESFVLYKIKSEA